MQKSNFALRWRITGVLLAAALLPLGLVGIGSLVVFGRLLEEKSLELHRRLVESHAGAVDLYLAERLRALDLVARSHGIEQLRDERELGRILDLLNESYGMSFVDLGIISETGEHLSYVGPYQLKEMNYAHQSWFQEAMLRGSFVSDVFMGFRHVPHCVMVVRRQQEGWRWLLRATVNSEQFDRIVHGGRLGQTGDAFIVNSEGVFQTPPRSGGEVLEQSTVGRLAHHQGVRETRATEGGDVLLRASAWINDGRWLLVVQQKESEIRAPVRAAMVNGLLVVLVAVALLIMAVVLATWYLTSRIDRARAQRDELYRDLIRSAKLASLGEMATGLAHEINNPLAIIGAELTNIGDLCGEFIAGEAQKEELLQSVKRCKRQIQRCGGITAKMLQFGRENEVHPEPTDIVPRLEEVRRLMHKQAEVKNVRLELDVEPNFPRLNVDATELEQVMLNLLNNSLYAIRGGGFIKIAARRRGREAIISVTDNGCGIEPDNLDKIFQPFFTTKPPGEGTGLGLSVCYGIVRTWGGRMEAESQPGQGTTISILLPVPGDQAHGPQEARCKP